MGTNFRVSVRNWNKFLAAIFEMQILKRDTLFHFRNFMNSKKNLHRDCWLSISAANIGNVAAWCAHSHSEGESLFWRKE